MLVYCVIHYYSPFDCYLMVNKDEYYYCLTCVSSVEPHRPVLNKKMSSPWGSPITSAKRWNVVRGTTIRRRQNFTCAWRKNEPYSLRQRCIPVSTTPLRQLGKVQRLTLCNKVKVFAGAVLVQKIQGEGYIAPSALSSPSPFYLFRKRKIGTPYRPIFLQLPFKSGGNKWTWGHVSPCSNV